LTAGFPTRTPAALLGLLVLAILTLWVQERWARSLFETGVFVLGAAWALRPALGRGGLAGHWILIPLGAAVLWPLLQLALRTTVYRFETWNAALYWTAAFVLAAVSLQCLGHEETRRRFLRALAWFGFLISVVSVVQLYTSAGKVFWLFQTPYKDLVLGPFVYHNNYGAFMELLLPVALYEALDSRRRTVLYTAMAGAMYASVIASTSRAASALATLEIAAALVISAVRGRVPARRLRTATLLLAGCAVVFAAAAGWQTLLERFRAPDPFVLRREMLASALAMGRERPWFGFGLGTFQTAYPAYALFDIGLIVNHAHNDWAEWFAEGGAPFVLLLLVVAGWSIGPAVRSVWGIGVLSVFLHALVDYPMQRLGLAAWVFVMLGALAAGGHGGTGPPERRGITRRR
jgi:O-antigen ligase